MIRTRHHVGDYLVLALPDGVGVGGGGGVGDRHE